MGKLSVHVNKQIQWNKAVICLLVYLVCVDGISCTEMSSVCWWRTCEQENERIDQENVTHQLESESKNDLKRTRWESAGRRERKVLDLQLGSFCGASSDDRCVSGYRDDITAHRAGPDISGGGGGDFTGSAGWFPKPQVIHFTFLTGLLATYAEAHSNYTDTETGGEAGHGMFESPKDFPLFGFSLNYQDTGKELEEQVKLGSGCWVGGTEVRTSCTELETKHLWCFCSSYREKSRLQSKHRDGTRQRKTETYLRGGIIFKVRAVDADVLAEREACRINDELLASWRSAGHKAVWLYVGLMPLTVIGQPLHAFCSDLLFPLETTPQHSRWYGKMKVLCWFLNCDYPAAGFLISFPSAVVFSFWRTACSEHNHSRIERPRVSLVRLLQTCLWLLIASALWEILFVCVCVCVYVYVCL